MYTIEKFINFNSFGFQKSNVQLNNRNYRMFVHKVGLTNYTSGIIRYKGDDTDPYCNKNRLKIETIFNDHFLVTSDIVYFDKNLIEFHSSNEDPYDISTSYKVFICYMGALCIFVSSLSSLLT
jgi:hypothetical protein